MTAIGEMEGRNIVLVDDLVDTGGTLCKAAEMMMDRGALSVRAICTHPVLSGKAYDNIAKSVLMNLLLQTLFIKARKHKNKSIKRCSLFAKVINTCIIMNPLAVTLFYNRKYK